MKDQNERLESILKNYKYYVSFVMNKKRGGDKNTIYSPQDAEEVVQKALLYYLEKPEVFNLDYFPHKLMQLRKNFIRDKKVEMRAKHNLKEKLIEVSEAARGDLQEEEMECYKSETERYIERMIEEKENLVQKSILTQYFVEGIRPMHIKTNHSNPRIVIKRFRAEIRDFICDLEG